MSRPRQALLTGLAPGSSASDNPGMVSELVLRQQTIESLVKVLKTDIFWVPIFVVAFMQQYTGPTAFLQVSLN